MRRNTALLGGGIALATFLVYFPSLRNGFVWDDAQYLLENPSIRTLGLDSLRWSFSHFYASNWHPLTWMSHALDLAVWGADPFGHHLTNILLHAANAVVVFILMLRLIATAGSHSSAHPQQGQRQDRTALIAAGTTALLFGLHPAHVESVAWVAERKDILCALFYLLSVHAYVIAASRTVGGSSAGKRLSLRTDRRYLVSFVLFVLALLSKPMAVTLPAVLLLLDVFPLRRVRSWDTMRSIVIEKLPFLAGSICSSVVTVWAQGSTGAIIQNIVAPFPTRLLVGAHALIAYLVKLAAPLTLVPFYPYPKQVELFSFAYLIPLFTIFAITVACMLLRKRQPVVPAVWIYYCVTLLPVLGFVQVGTQAMADRYTYLPSIGPFLLVGLGVAWSWNEAQDRIKGRRVLQYAVLAVLLAFIAACAVRTTQQIGVWKDNIVLWDYVVSHEPGSSFAFNNRGNAYAEADRSDLAISDYTRAIELDPLYHEAYNNIGIEFGKLGLFDKAIGSFDNALRIDPDHSEAYVNRGIIHALAGRPKSALADLDLAIRISPRLAQAYLTRGKVYREIGDHRHAVPDFQTACDLGNSEACDIVRSLAGG